MAFPINYFGTLWYAWCVGYKSWCICRSVSLIKVFLLMTLLLSEMAHRNMLLTDNIPVLLLWEYNAPCQKLSSWSRKVVITQRKLLNNGQSINIINHMNQTSDEAKIFSLSFSFSYSYKTDLKFKYIFAMKPVCLWCVFHLWKNCHKEVFCFIKDLVLCPFMTLIFINTVYLNISVTMCKFTNAASLPVAIDTAEKIRYI